MREIKFRLLLDGKIVGYEWYIIVNRVMCTMHRREGESTEYLVYTDPDNLDKSPVHTYNPIIHDTKEQYTGLHDAIKWNELTEDEQFAFTCSDEWIGREIYEGDIIRSRKGEFYERIGKVVYIENKCGVLGSYASEDSVGFLTLSDMPIIKKIGNIHESPELLNKS